MDEISVERDVSVEMRDDVELATDIYRPRGAESCPTIVHRNPYDKSNAGSVAGLIVNPLDAVQEGFAVVVQDTRGRFKSEGEWDPFVHEAEDGYDTVEWAAEQPWSNGRVGVYGASYHGVTVLQAMVADPPSLEAVFAYLTGANYHRGWTYTGGAFELGFNQWWNLYNAMDNVTRLDVPEDERAQLTEELLDFTEDPEDIAEQLPVKSNDLFEHPAAECAQEWFEHPQYDSYWEDIDVTAQLDGVDIPLLNASGWYDVFLPGHLDLYEAVSEKSGPRASEKQRLVVGPWDHEAYVTVTPDRGGERKFGYRAAGGTAMMSDLSLEWFDYWLGDGDQLDIPSVQYYQMGDNEWRTAESWPPEHEPTPYYLHSGGNANSRSGDGYLSPSEPDSESVDSYEYDPANPVPTTGGRSLHPNIDDPGITDRSEVETRDDVLVYTSEQLIEPCEIAGPVDATLYVATSAPDTDFVATLVDVEPDDYCVPVTEGIRRARYRDGFEEESFLKPGERYEIPINMEAVAHTFDTGHRIRLEVTSSNFPKFDRNLNIAAPVGEGTLKDAQVATQNIFHTAEAPSYVSLPVR
jgi:putative CocE/NonD family hydrolase